MTAAEEPTLYDVLEVEPGASLDELQAAVERARETYGPESLAVYALVDESQLEDLRARLARAAEVLLDPTRRASYDRSIGRIGPATLWTEDEEEDEAPLPPVQPAPHPTRVELELRNEEREHEAPEPRQQALALEVSETPGPFGRGPETFGASPPPEPVEEAVAAEQAPAPLLNGDWAAAVAFEPAPEVPPEPPADATEVPAALASQPAPEVEVAAIGESAPAPPMPEVSAPAPARSPRLPALGLRIRQRAARPVAAVSAKVAEDAARASSAAAEPNSRQREARARLDIPPDVEFSGELLRRVRESYGLSLQQVADRTRITRIHLENVEADRYDRLPATVYLRGILVNLARELRLDPARVSKTYLLAAQRAHARAP